MKSRHYPSNGRERALLHIEEARKLSLDLAGVDNDVKRYFFSMNESQFKAFMSKYQAEYGEKARVYAEETFFLWESGQRQMSGLVMSRLFNLLPSVMPIEDKYRLVEKLWAKLAPSSSKCFYIKGDESIGSLTSMITNHINNVVVDHKIPEKLEARFNWISNNDIKIKQQILNFLISKEKEAVANTLPQKLQVVVDHIKTSKGDFSSQITHTMIIGRHQISISIEKEFKVAVFHHGREIHNRKPLHTEPIPSVSPGCLVFLAPFIFPFVFMIIFALFL